MSTMETSFGESGPVRSLFCDRRAQSASGETYSLITGGAGFIGTNVAHRLLAEGHQVLLYDNLSRDGVEQNIAWLRRLHGAKVQLEIADIRDRGALHRALKKARQVFHFAAQVAVTNSVIDPKEDFEINLMGTLNLLEELRMLSTPPPLVFTSTNKVYGTLNDVELCLNGSRYLPFRPEISSRGISEIRALCFHTPYGCSKGSADQYVIDYVRTYGIPAAVFRMSCIYGPHQFGTEDQGWVAHFIIQAINDKIIILYGDGKQVRDILFVEDLVDAFLLAQSHMAGISGQAFNIGGGPKNTISLIELLDLIGEMHGQRPRIEFDDWRVGDQRYYVSDYSKFQAATGWSPRVTVADGVSRLHNWIIDSRKNHRITVGPTLVKDIELNQGPPA